MSNTKLVFLLFICCLQAQVFTTPVETHGALSIKGNKMVDQFGNPVNFKGMSLFWSQWTPQFWNGDVLSWLVKDWKIEIVRAAMAVNRDGYVANPEREKAKVVKIIESAISLGIYVIVDWHAENEDPQVEHAKVFFGEIAMQYGMVPNVLFEPFNEPSPNSWPATKAYHETIVPIIRRYSNNICILGTATWSQDVDVAAKDRVSGENLAYTLHFYAATHKQSLRDKGDYALKSGIAIFITEWGTCEASGAGGLDFGETGTWLSWAKQNKIGNTNWAVYDKSEACASLQPGTSGAGNWPSSQLTQSGNYLRNYLRGDSPAPPTPPSGNGCCSWDGGNSCGDTTDYCKANQAHCENDCNGKWKNLSSSRALGKISLIVQDHTSDLEKCLLTDMGNLLTDLKSAIDTKDITKIGAVLKDLYAAWTDCKKLLPGQVLVAATKLGDCQAALTTIVNTIKDFLSKVVHFDCDMTCMQDSYNTLVRNLSDAKDQCIPH